MYDLRGRTADCIEKNHGVLFSLCWRFLLLWRGFGGSDSGDSYCFLSSIRVPSHCIALRCLMVKKKEILDPEGPPTDSNSKAQYSETEQDWFLCCFKIEMVIKQRNCTKVLNSIAPCVILCIDSRHQLKELCCWFGDRQGNVWWRYWSSSRSDLNRETNDCCCMNTFD